MIAGRAGVFGFMAYKKYKENLKKNPNQIYQYLVDHANKIKKDPKFNQQKLVYYDKPIMSLIFSIFFCSVGVSLFLITSMGNHGFLFSDFHDTFLWEYMISVGIFLMGFIFLLSIRITRIEFNKQLNKIIVAKINIMCLSRATDRNFQDLLNISVVKRGYNGNIATNQIVNIDLFDEKNIIILKITLQYTQIILQQEKTRFFYNKKKLDFY